MIRGAIVWAAGSMIALFLLTWDVLFSENREKLSREDWRFFIGCSLAWPVTIPMVIWYWLFGQPNSK